MQILGIFMKQNIFKKIFDFQRPQGQRIALCSLQLKMYDILRRGVLHNIYFLAPTGILNLVFQSICNLIKISR